MNEVGLMFDGLRSPAKSFAGNTGKPPIHFDDLARRVLRSCANVHEAAALIRTFDFGELNGAYLIFVDCNGEYLVVEADTLFTGNEATYAVTNFCVSTCTDLDALPSERYQRGRAMLAAGGTRHWMYQLDHRWYFSPESMEKILLDRGFSEVVHADRVLRPGWGGEAHFRGPSRMHFVRELLAHPTRAFTAFSTFSAMKQASGWPRAGVGIFTLAARI